MLQICMMRNDRVAMGPEIPGILAMFLSYLIFIGTPCTQLMASAIPEGSP